MEGHFCYLTLLAAQRTAVTCDSRGSSGSTEFLVSAKWTLFPLLFITVVSWKMSNFVSNSVSLKVTGSIHLKQSLV